MLRPSCFPNTTPWNVQAWSILPSFRSLAGFLCELTGALLTLIPASLGSEHREPVPGRGGECGWDTQSLGPAVLVITVQEPDGGFADEASPEAHGGLPAEVHEGLGGWTPKWLVAPLWCVQNASCYAPSFPHPLRHAVTLVSWAGWEVSVPWMVSHTAGQARPWSILIPSPFPRGRIMWQRLCPRPPPPHLLGIVGHLWSSSACKHITAVLCLHVAFWVFTSSSL